MIDHTDVCPGGPVVLKQGRYGDLLSLCKGCGHFVPVRHESAAEVPAPEPERRPQNLDRLLARLAVEGHDRRQTERNGNAWPRHKARKRGRRRRNIARERNDAA